ncbi:hypothetical protein Pelo_12963 [Pelomyxa schiedti]|nr:hypothetical protein Pelo_12963 [Pelomyxa schiedti]
MMMSSMCPNAQLKAVLTLTKICSLLADALTTGAEYGLLLYLATPASRFTVSLHIDGYIVCQLDLVFNSLNFSEFLLLPRKLCDKPLRSFNSLSSITSWLGFPLEGHILSTSNLCYPLYSRIGASLVSNFDCKTSSLRYGIQSRLCTYTISPAWDCQIVGRYYPLGGSILQCKMSPLYVVVASQPSKTISFSPLVTVKVTMYLAFPISTGESIRSQNSSNVSLIASAFAILGIWVTCFSVEHESIMIVMGLSLTFPLKVDNQVPNLLPNACVLALASELAAVDGGIVSTVTYQSFHSRRLSTIAPLVTISSTVMTFDVTISKMRCLRR